MKQRTPTTSQFVIGRTCRLLGNRSYLTRLFNTDPTVSGCSPGGFASLLCCCECAAQTEAAWGHAYLTLPSPRYCGAYVCPYAELFFQVPVCVSLNKPKVQGGIISRWCPNAQYENLRRA